MKNLIIKNLMLIGLAVVAGPAFAGGTSGVGPYGPDAAAQIAFEQDANVATAVEQLYQQGYTEGLGERAVNQFVGPTNCGKLTPDATGVACDRLSIFVRSYSLPHNTDEVRAVSATVHMSLSAGIRVEIVK